MLCCAAAATIRETKQPNMPLPRATRLKSDKYASNITKRGLAEVKPEAKKEQVAKAEESRVHWSVYAFLGFVIFGSSIFGLLESLKRKL